MSQKRLLLIEDDYDVSEMLVMYFSAHGYEVHHADSGQAGVNLARTSFPNLILLDVMLPDFDGYEVCLKLRKTSFTRYIPIIFLTQRDERANKVRGLELGADDYVTKPFDIDELRLRVNGAIKRATRESLHESRTGLPTGTLIKDELSRHVDAHALRLQLDGFTAYSEIYGFMAANDVLGYTAQTIKRVIGAHGTTNDFVGFAEGDFVILTYHEDPAALRVTLETAFAEGIKAFYSFSDVDQGGITLYTGTEHEQFLPLMQLADSTAPSG
jgi:DNA-binding response OmpR family regulator